MGNNKPRDCVQVYAFESNDALVKKQVIPCSKWYDSRHPLIDSATERMRLGVLKIRGKQYDEMGFLEMEWLAHYAADGAFVEGWEWRGSDPPKYRRLRAK